MSRKNGDWTISGTEEKFANDYFEVNEDRVIRPDGKPDVYATIDFKPGVSVLPIDYAGYIYLTSQFRYALGRKNVETASGAIAGDEISLDAAERELREELGIEADEWTDLGTIEADTSITNSTAHLFIAEHLSFENPERESTEDIEIITMPLEEAVEKVMMGEITHDQTVVLILKAYVESEKGR